MPCYRCGSRQVDPGRGESDWRRGVRGDRQVLICPGCQAAVDWTSELDRCRVCGSVHLVRRLGEAECRDCGAVGQPTAEPSAVAEPNPVTGLGMTGGPEYADNIDAELAQEVELALSRVLGASRQRPPFALS